MELLNSSSFSEQQKILSIEKESTKRYYQEIPLFPFTYRGGEKTKIKNKDQIQKQIQIYNKSNTDFQSLEVEPLALFSNTLEFLCNNDQRHVDYHIRPKAFKLKLLSRWFHGFYIISNQITYDSAQTTYL